MDYTLKELAEVLELSYSRVRQLHVDGNFPNAFKRGVWFIPKEDVKSYLFKRKGETKEDLDRMNKILKTIE